MRVFFFPYAGGGPAVFGKWIAGLPAYLEGWIVHYAGRGSRHNEPPIARMEVLVKELAQAIPPLSDKPFVFFGHSMGGLIAFELARELRQIRRPQPGILFVSACGAPHMPAPHPKIHRLPDSEFVRELKKLGGIPPEILQSSEALEILLPALRADFEIVETYEYEMDDPLDYSILAFGGLDDPRVSREGIEAWAARTSSAFRSQYFSGDHFFIHAARESVVETINASLPRPTG